MSKSYNISGVPDDLPPGEYDITLDYVRYVSCRDGSIDLVFETAYCGPHNPADPTLLCFTKENPEAQVDSLTIV